MTAVGARRLFSLSATPCKAGSERFSQPADDLTTKPGGMGRKQQASALGIYYVYLTLIVR